MIDYEVLVQTIADWKAGVRPTAPTPPPRDPMGAPQQVEELSSGVVDFDDEVSFSTEAEAEAEAEDVGYGYDPSQYEQPVESYEDDEG